jgi:hypothetical protein
MRLNARIDVGAIQRITIAKIVWQVPAGVKKELFMAAIKKTVG